jgi:hypothetical protein
MALDPSIPLRAQTVNFAPIVQNFRENSLRRQLLEAQTQKAEQSNAMH